MTAITTAKPLKFNILGRVFGNRAVTLTEKDMSLNTKKGSRVLLSFSETKRFVSVENGVFGSTLFIPNDQSFKEYKFLSKAVSLAFVDVVNKQIAYELEPYVVGL